MFSLQIPIDIPAGKKIHGSAGPIIIDSLQYSCSAAESGFILVISGFPTEEAADRYFLRIRDACIWLLLKFDLPASIPRGEKPRRPVFAALAANSTHGARGVYDASDPVVYKLGSELEGVKASITAHERRNAADLLYQLCQWSRSPFDGAPSKSKKLSLACELYKSHWNEEGTKSQFLTLLMALESLCVSVKKPPAVQSLMDSWERSLKELKQSSADSEVAYELDRLKDEISFRRGASIKTQLRNLVKTSLSERPPEEITAALRTVNDAYTVRSTLLHTGEATFPPDLFHKTKQLVQAVLMGQFQLRS